MTDWRRSRVAATLIIAVFVVVQLAIPISRFGWENGQRFGWQMFSKASQDLGFKVVTPSREIDIALADYMAMSRADMDLTDLLPQHLCAIVPEAETVTWEGGSHTC